MKAHISTLDLEYENARRIGMENYELSKPTKVHQRNSFKDKNPSLFAMNNEHNSANKT